MDTDLTSSTSRLINDIDSLINACSPLSGEENEKIRVQIHNWRDRIVKPCRLAIMGRVSSGKSSFVNELLGDNLATVSVLAETATINLLTTKLAPKASKPILCEYKEASAPVWINADEAKKLQGTGDNMKIIQRIRWLVYHLRNLNSPLLNEIELADTPGLNALAGEDGHVHDEITQDFMNNIDAILYVVQDTVQDRDIDTLREFINKTNQRSSLGIFVVLSQIDVGCQDAEDMRIKGAERAKQRLHDLQEQLGAGRIESILPISAIIERIYREMGEDWFVNLHKALQYFIERTGVELITLLLDELESWAQQQDHPCNIATPELSELYRQLYEKLSSIDPRTERRFPPPGFKIIVHELLKCSDTYPVNDAITALRKAAGIESIRSTLVKEIQARKDILKLKRIIDEIDELYFHVSNHYRRRQEELNREQKRFLNFCREMKDHPEYSQGSLGQDLQEFINKRNPEIIDNNFLGNWETLHTEQALLSHEVSRYERLINIYSHMSQNPGFFSREEETELRKLCNRGDTYDSNELTTDFAHGKIMEWRNKARNNIARRSKIEAIVEAYEDIFEEMQQA